MLRTTYLHSGWEFVQSDREGKKLGYSLAEWLPAEVPGHVHVDLVANGVIADPHAAMNEMGCQWVDQESWTYRTSFQWTPDKSLPHRILRFEGLDTVCTIRLNDDIIAQHDNMFVPLEIDISKVIKAGTNEIRVEFQSAVKVAEQRQAEYFAKEDISTDVQWWPERTFVRKAQFMYGWDWGPRLVSCGIWRPVSLKEYSARILDVHATQQHHKDGSVTVTLVSEISGRGVAIHEVNGIPGESARYLKDGSFTVNKAPAWEPANLSQAAHDGSAEGENSLIVITTRLVSSEDAPAILRSLANQSVDSEFDTDDLDVPLLDRKETRIGFSQIRLLREPDQFGESFEFEVNGKKLWIRGANWIPDHSFPSMVTRQRYREQLERVVDLGMNMLRVWGGGLYETDEFYDLCDELGILVWQDFPFACGYYPDDEATQKAVQIEAEANIKRLRNHPCLALWCGNNENSEMHVNRWGDKTKHPTRYYGEKHYDHVLPTAVSKLDPGRSYIPTSPIGEDSQSEPTDEKRRGPNSDGYGDQHNWDVWHGRGDWRYYSDSKGRFSSEYGFGSSCSLAVWEKQIGLPGSTPFVQENKAHKTIRWHDKTQKGYETFVGYTKLHYPDPQTLADWVYYSQLNQRDALRHGLEHYRRSEFCRGSLIWQMNDCWPVQSWAFVDSEGNYKALAYELRRLHADELLSLVRDGDKVQVWAVNDSEEVAEGELVVRAFDTVSGALVREEFVEIVELAANGRKQILSFSVQGLPVPQTIVHAYWRDSEAWKLLGEPKQTRLPKPCPLLISTAEDSVLTIQSSAPLIDLVLTDHGSTKPFDENVITLPEPALFAVPLVSNPTRIEARSVAGVHEVILTRSPL